MLNLYYFEYTRLGTRGIEDDLLEKLVEVGTDNRHFFILREDVEELSDDPDVPEHQRAVLKEWLAARPDDEDLHFGFNF